MISNEDLVSWLQVTNRRYGEESVPHRTRPFLALCDFTRERKCSIPFDHPIAKFVFQWFYSRSPPDAHQVGAVYTAVFFYDTAFWPLSVPLVFGRASVDAFECLETMPAAVKADLGMNQRYMRDYVNHWANCMDYGYGQMDISSSQTLNARAADFLSAAHAEIQGANAQLLDARPNHKAILSFRMATEIFLKAVLVQELDLSDRELKKISHTIEDAAKKCAEATGEATFEEVANRAHVYPQVSARYDQSNWPPHEVWEAAALAQLTAAAATRLYSDRDMRSQIISTKQDL